MKSFIQILSAGAMDGGGPAVLVFFDNTRYLINCGEGLQRFCGEHRIKLGKLSNIFLSKLSWDCAGGIPGLISTLADAGATDRLHIVGPRNTRHVLAAMRPFLHRANYAVSVDELSAGRNSFDTDDLQVRVIELKAPKGLKEQESPEVKRRKSEDEKALGVENLDIIASPDSSHFLLKMFKDPSTYGSAVPEEALTSREHYHDVESERMTQCTRLPHTRPTHSSLCYIIEGPETPGKFLSQTAKQLGVPHGPLNGRLQKGEPVELPDGTIVTPEMCIGPATPGTIFIYLDVPSLQHASDLLKKLDELDEFGVGGAQADRLRLVIHYVPRSVFNSELYRKGNFMQWPEHVHHAHIDESHHLVLESSAAMQQILHSNLDPLVYPIPFGGIKSSESCEPLTKFHWINTTKPQPLMDVSESQSLAERLSCFRRINSSCSPADDVVVTVLGTGAAIPGKYRNVSATLVTADNSRSYLLDCGEGTCAQILRAHGSQFEHILQSIEFIFISHLHADHHAGLVGLLRHRQALSGSLGTVTIVAPQRYQLWLEEYAECEPICEYDFISAESLVDSSVTLSCGAQFVTVPVEHCPRSFAGVLTLPALPRPIAFSGDTRPCEALIKAGQHASLLIHEATMGDDLQAEAVAKRHCTISEAITVGKAMKAEHVLLTHFSQRYAKTAPPLPEGSENVSVAFDLMQISLKSIGTIEGQAYNLRLRELLPEDVQTVDEEICLSQQTLLERPF